MPDQVYYLQRMVDGCIKIGHSVDIRSALSRSTLGAGPCVLLAVEPGGVAMERNRHAKFSRERIHGEWFKPSLRLSRHISQLQGSAAVTTDMDHISDFVAALVFTGSENRQVRSSRSELRSSYRQFSGVMMSDNDNRWHALWSLIDERAVPYRIGNDRGWYGVAIDASVLQPYPLDVSAKSLVNDAS